MPRTTHGKRYTPEYRAWVSMKQRCTNGSLAEYPRYGGRGIVVCPRWAASFEAFFEDMGPRPTPAHSIDRVDNNGGYTPENTRWATSREQNGNRSSCRMVEVEGALLNEKAASRQLGVNYHTLRWRRERDKPLDAPTRPRVGPVMYEGREVSIPDLAKATGIKYSTLLYRLKAGQTVEQATKKKGGKRG